MFSDSKLTALQARSRAGLDALLGSVERIAWVDFPDYSNVGDSAIWLGQDIWARSAGLTVVASLPARAVGARSMSRLRRNSVTPFINGGGNFGGLYAGHHLTRLKILNGFRGEDVIQAPQSVHFANHSAEAELKEAIGKVRNFRMAVRDRESKEAMSGLANVLLLPDSAHLLGRIESPSPLRSSVELVRTDAESATGSAGDGTADWLIEPTLGRRVRQARAQIYSLTGLSQVLSSQERYRAAAVERLSRGIAQLGVGEVVITDRLHAMILALQMGKQVYVVDNSVKKLSRYAEAWLEGSADGAIVWVESVEAAKDLI